eukprot:6182896-Pleurochrysis_carterae.AAC.2
MPAPGKETSQTGRNGEHDNRPNGCEKAEAFRMRAHEKGRKREIKRGGERRREGESEGGKEGRTVREKLRYDGDGDDDDKQVLTFHGSASSGAFMDPQNSLGCDLCRQAEQKFRLSDACGESV